VVCVLASDSAEFLVISSRDGFAALKAVGLGLSLVHLDSIFANITSRTDIPIEQKKTFCKKTGFRGKVIKIVLPVFLFYIIPIGGYADKRFLYRV